MSEYKISVVVPTYNTGDFLKQSFNSFKSQSIGFENIEVIFVDDASTDKYTVELLNKLDYDYDNVKSIFLKDNSGYPGTGRNTGLKNASADFIIFADHDDTYEKDAFEVMYNEMIRESADIVISNYYKVYGNEKIKEETVFNGERIAIEEIDDDLRLFDIGPAIWTKLFRKEFLTRNNIYFIERMLAEDVELYVHSLILADKIIYLDDFYGYNYKIRDSDSDKSTIHLRSKETFEKMIMGYYKIDQLLKDLNKEEYFSNVFKRHFIYWILRFSESIIPDNDKIDLIKSINPLLKKQVAITPNFDEKQFSSLTKPILDDDFEKILKNIKKIKKSRDIKAKIKSILRI